MYTSEPALTVDLLAPIVIVNGCSVVCPKAGTVYTMQIKSNVRNAPIVPPLCAGRVSGAPRAASPPGCSHAFGGGLLLKRRLFRLVGLRLRQKRDGDGVGFDI